MCHSRRSSASRVVTERIIHWDSDYAYCQFPQEADALYEPPHPHLKTSIEVHVHGSLRESWKHDWSMSLKTSKKFENSGDVNT